MPNGHYNYNEEDVYKFLNKDVKRKTYIYARVSTPCGMMRACLNTASV